MTGHRFHVDLDELDDVIGHLRRRQALLQALGDRLDAEVARVHDSWDGRAAAAHTDAHARWTAGFAALQAAVADLRRAAGTASDNYTRAAETNLQLWRQLV